MEGKVERMPEDLSNVVDLRKVLCEEINRLRNGNTTPAALNAIVNASGKVISSVKLELEYNKVVGISPNIKFVGGGRGNEKQIENKENERR